MTAAIPHKAITDFDQLVIHLERNHRCVLRLSRKLGSYKYEPKNYECFIKLRDLRNGFDDLAKDQMVLFDLIQHHSLDLDTATDKVEDTLTRFGQLEKDFAAYLLALGAY